ncbi:hypothetical protein PR048_020129 [Dryococelus australis]|uniref:HAT C-terminal dimerisation domain-containing protein n=1 Tax=Dryococelus australis TaxID=614101 RepID=A0ABQ9H5G7_9NEOP|nr:hypothetical protein PR048_020129 [Dryococelus australis]
MKILRQRKEFCFHPGQHAACLLAPKQKGSMLTEEETSVAIQTISDIAETITDVDAIVVLDNLAEYKAEHKACSSKAIWNVANNASPVTWWKGFHGTSPLAKVAIHLLHVKKISSLFQTSKLSKETKLISERITKLLTIHYILHLLEENDLEETEKEGQPLPQSSCMRRPDEGYAPEPEVFESDVIVM